MATVKSHVSNGTDRVEALTILGLTAAAQDEDVRSAFRQRLKHAHPDLTGGTDARLRRLILARDLLISDRSTPVEISESMRELHNANALGDGIIPLTISLQQAIHGGMALPEVPALEFSHAEDRVVSLTQTKTLRVTLPKGLRDGEKVHLKVQGGARDDMFFRINVDADSQGRAWGDDIWMTAAIDRHLLTYGGKATIETPHGPQSVRIDRDIPDGASLCLRGKGLPATETASAGNLYIRLEARADSITAVTHVLSAFRERWAS